MKPALQTRLFAYRALHKIIFEQETLDSAFPVQSTMEQLGVSDRHFVRLLVFTVLRRYGQLKALLKPFLSKPLPARRQEIELILLLGIAQLYFLKTPPHAAVDTSVELVRHLKQSSFTRLINGVLRSFVRTGLEMPEPPARLNIPQWLYESWMQTYGEEKAALFVQAFLEPAPLDISVRENAEKWATRLNGRVLPTGTVRCAFSEAVPELDGFAEGNWWVQEASASIPAQLFTTVRGLKGIDLCAAPGGKTVQLAVRGAKITACDISEHRLGRLQENMERLHLNRQVSIRCKDVLSFTEKEKYDFVLLDAPCSATGTIRRHPDLFFHRTRQDVKRLATLQKRMLAVALRLVRAGGEVVYATCSLQEAENEGVVSAVLKDFPDVERVELTQKRWQPFLNRFGAVQVTPDTGMDGFYAVLLRKKEQNVKKSFTFLKKVSILKKK